MQEFFSVVATIAGLHLIAAQRDMWRAKMLRWKRQFKHH